ncbi:MAG: hypothetical protein SWQ30_14250 [Thermodesulfobacteriota bacterium]|nr:hypothetical protein [Thermodesulfobacteriota bacterium]
MKTYGLILATLSFLTCPSICLPSYVIELESGSELVVDYHWKDNGKIAFYFHGGVVAIPRHLVRNIRESDAPPGQDDPSLRQSGRTRQVAGESAMTSGETRQRRSNDSAGEVDAGLQANGKDKETNFDYYKKQRLLLKSDLEEATQRFREASSSKDLQAKQEAIQDMTKSSKELYSLSKELEAKNNGVLPDWWD